MTEVFLLNRKQILQLAELAEKFPDTEWFTLESDSSSGIGAAITVKFTALDKDKDFDTTVDITDLSTW
jgi:hypothetical protein